jgi:hypothetical protein
VNDSFLKLGEIVNLAEVDLVTAAAVFDLLSLNMLEEFLKLLLDAKVALLATINYTGMRFKPEQVGDIYYADLYSKHMKREQAFGVSLGPDCSRGMMNFYHRKNIDAVCGPSNWKVSPADLNMNNFLFEYMENAIPEMLKGDQEVEPFNLWIDKKKELLENGQLTTEVLHFDIFAA